MADAQTPAAGARLPLEDVQDAILDQLHAGEAIERAEWVARHPEHAEALGRFFQILDVLEVPPDPATGQPVRLGEYEIGPEIGRGGMGVVYRALQMPLNRPVALKILPPALRQDRKLLKRFQRESAAAGRLRHPNIVPVYSVGEAGGAPFFAMEFVEGCSLADLLRHWKAERGAQDVVDTTGAASSAPATAASYVATFPEHLPRTDAERVPWAVELMARVLDALDYAHAEGIVHRDVKPGNILLESDGTPRLTDFGLALDLAATELTVTGEVFGSPLYMSPEQAFRCERPIDARSDIYSVAVTLYELLALRLPYAGSSRNALVSALGDGQLVPLSEVAPDVPPGLEAVIHKAMSHEPGDRFRRASDFATALRESLEHPTELPRGVPKLKRTAAATGKGTKRAWMRRHPVATGFLALVGLMFAMAILGSIVFLFLAFMPASGDPVAWEPTLEQLELLADGKLPYSEALLAQWFQPTLHVRSLVARDAPGVCEVRYELDAPEMPPGLYVGVGLTGDVDGEPGGPPQFSFTYSPADAGVGSLHGATVRRIALEQLLDGYLDRDVVDLTVRATLRIQHWPRDPEASGFVGTDYEVVFDEKTLILHDSYPDDYPIAVSDPATDAAMRSAFTPASAWPNRTDLDSLAAPGLFLRFASPPLGPVPGCFDVDVLAAKSDTVLAVVEHGFAPDARALDSRNPQYFLDMTPAPDLSPEHQSELEALNAGKLDTVRLRFRSSRDLALARPDVERYWAGSFVAEVPVDFSP